MNVRFYATLRPIVGGKIVQFDFEQGTVRDVLVAAGSRFPDLDALMWDAEGGLRDYLKVFVEGREIRHLQMLETRVLAHMEIDVFPPVAGG